ncbi:MAG: 2-C-methyl-D-erythritol 2,4-cyclodiphosphate synthase [Candidatus Eremiobacteraeota bacterium]|nr:2-C-methyl-D-erythritol 2,4-cyclodiphosphate synthase [Candidatus Eremiobacteraeota bacterium]MBV8668968.1 2-C-methyl-D-erythritol 2,4-cyclodiphosphate synthase [Candidatus Eremiobacteraeota bacterium]
MRVGFGFDAHRLVPGRPLVLAGCRVPFDKGLEGYSDADVAAHAAIDAILGAAGLGDCGTLFPAGDPQFAGADSVELLRRAVQQVRDAGFAVGNLDCTIVAERPQLAPHIQQMRANLAAAIGVSLDSCNVKAKHTEGMGYTGEGIGMAAYAVATLVP